jgi:hypothetical protein
MTTSQRTAERQEILQQTRIVWGRCLEMARRNYVNPSDRGFEAQVAQFLANLGPVKTALGLPANWEAQLQDAQKQLHHRAEQFRPRRSELPPS